MGWELRRRAEASARCAGLARFALGIIADEIRDAAPEKGTQIPYPVLAARMGVPAKAAIRAVKAAVKAGDLVKVTVIGVENTYRLPVPESAVVPESTLVPEKGVDQSQNRPGSSAKIDPGKPTGVPPPPPPVQQKREVPNFDELARAGGLPLSGKSPRAKKAGAAAQVRRDTRFELGDFENHPAIKTHRKRCGLSTGLTPALAIQIIGTVEDDIAGWDAALLDWMSSKSEKTGQPYRASNITGQLERYENLRLHGAAVAAAPVKKGSVPAKFRRQMEYTEA